MGSLLLAFATMQSHLGSVVRGQSVSGGSVADYLEANLPSAATLPPWDGRLKAKITAIYEVDTPRADGFSIGPRTRMSAALGLGNLNIEVLDVEPLTVDAGKRCLHHYSLLCKYDWTADAADVRAPGVGGASPNSTLYYSHPRLCRGADAGASAFDSSLLFAQSQPLGGYIPLWEPPLWTQVDSNGEIIDECAFSTLYVANPNLLHSACLDFERKVWTTPLCVSNRNTSLQYYPMVLNNTYVTGYRDPDNRVLQKSAYFKMPLMLRIVGKIAIQTALFLGRKFILNGTIPLPEISPEVFDEGATHTAELNLKIPILGVRQGGNLAMQQNAVQESIPVCLDPPKPMKGCFRISFHVYTNVLTDYHLRDRVQFKMYKFVKDASDQPYPFGSFNVSAGPWPSLDIAPGEGFERKPGPWQHRTFPQSEWRDVPLCQTGSACAYVPLAPSARYLHSAVYYKTWNFEDHARPYLCNEEPTCKPDCLSNLTCLGGKKAYFSQFFYFNSAWFIGDDGGDVPILGLDSPDCPNSCCEDRRMCMRSRDALGYHIPFDSPTILMFGGRTYEQIVDPLTGKLVFHTCERIGRTRLTKEWRGCGEVITNDLWRYDILRAEWQFLKFDTSNDVTTGKSQGFPLARYAHGAALVEVVVGKVVRFKRMYMYIYGGLGNMCGGVCNDVWKYEVPFAARAYYPKFPDGVWESGNMWYRMRNNPFGGRYRHEMITNYEQSFIYVFGGQEIGGFMQQLLRYRVATDVWEDLSPFGRVSLTRLMYDHAGRAQIAQIDPANFDKTIDVDCRNAWRYDGAYSHCRVCPQCRLSIGEAGTPNVLLPSARGDFSMNSFLDDTPGATDDRYVIFGGFRTTWGLKADRNRFCTVTTTMPLSPVFVTTTTLPPPTPPAWAVDSGPAPPPPGSVSEMETLGYARTTATSSTTTTPPPTILSDTVMDEVIVDNTASGNVIQTGPSVDLNTDFSGVIPSNPSTGIGLPPEPVWDNNGQTTTTTTSTGITKGTTTTKRISNWTTFAPTGAPTVRTTTTTTLRNPKATTVTTSTTTSTETTTTGLTTTSTTTTQDWQKPVVSGLYVPPESAESGYSSPVGKSQPIPDIGPCSNGEVSQYYFNDLWVFESSVNQWVERSVTGAAPTPRRGHKVIARRSRTNDTMLVLFGGHNQDNSFDDLWVLNLNADEESRIWTRMDPYLIGQKPPKLTHHTMTLSEETGQFLIIGGLTWRPTDMVRADARNNIDRRCLKEAQALPERYANMQEETFLLKMRKLCLDENVLFCCGISQWAQPNQNYVPPSEYLGDMRVRTDEGYINLTALSVYCRKDCESNMFIAEFYPLVVEGVFSFNFDTCDGNCSGHGKCEMSQCICEAGWYGIDCAIKRCPGSVCYTHPRSKEQTCIECSQHGRCVIGACDCFPGWGLYDCSAPVCRQNCSSTTTVTQGVCIEDFPAHQCVCTGTWSGTNCSVPLCLNGCSRHGQCLDGECSCDPNYFGSDCSIYVFEPGGSQ